MTSHDDASAPVSVSCTRSVLASTATVTSWPVQHRHMVSLTVRSEAAHVTTSMVMASVAHSRALVPILAVGFSPRHLVFLAVLGTVLGFGFSLKHPYFRHCSSTNSGVLVLVLATLVLGEKP